MAIEINQLVKKYGSLEVLSVDHLVFESGKTYGVIGPNGAGKTTLFKCMTNIITDYQGDVKINEISVREDNSVLANLGIVLDGVSVYKERTGWFNIEYFSGLRGEYNLNKAEALARELNLSEYLGNKVKTYSYGMVKKLILLIALLHDPNILILDEPFRGLDSETVDWFKLYLKKMTSQGMTLIISSHVKSDIEMLCEEVIIIRKGHPVRQMSLSDIEDTKIRDIDTSNQEAFLIILESLNYYSKVLPNDYIRVDIKDERWSEVTQLLNDQNINIYEMKKVTVLDDHLNGGSN
ncbi:ABC transporter ATP-binding protein [Vagococcus luciliae]|uniref:Bacitracin transport ATP-binding protein BcrA n=1 Tax=Vagococcus luciliae TaxID=2920380 RepID=A0ABY5NZP0_9ENTE|nr:ABC transporter ATP-binding protein [Vagococcus luciliae]UUV99134.1 Bacitracin transport ATP-binding protein BcrA [Vagococcus luciliae]